MNKLYFQYDLKKAQIVEKERVSKPFVTKWTESPDQDFERDDRGWEKGKGRIYGTSVKEMVLALHKQLSENPKNYFTGSTAIYQEWIQQYPDDLVPSIRTIGRIRKSIGYGLNFVILTIIFSMRNRFLKVFPLFVGGVLRHPFLFLRV